METKGRESSLVKLIQHAPIQNRFNLGDLALEVKQLVLGPAPKLNAGTPFVASQGIQRPSDFYQTGFDLVVVH